MRLPGRVSAAIEVLAEVIGRHRPASEALKDWGKAHRFAGSGDRHAIGTLVYDALRHRNSAAHASGSATPRGLVLGTLRTVWQRDVAEISELTADQHGPDELTADEQEALNSPKASTVPHVLGDFPQWLQPSLQRVFGENCVSEMQALAERAPVDLRVNTLKASREQVIAALDKFSAAAAGVSPWGVRIAAPGPDQRHPGVEAEQSHGLGWFEVQDLASQIGALASAVQPGEKVADICAGAGGKTLALAAMMQNRGQLVAHDIDKRRLRPIFERLTRAGVTCVEVLAVDEADKLSQMSGFDCVLIDAPCTGTGTWRRKPDAKWKLKPATLAQRCKDQKDVLARAARLLKPGGRLIYLTCSVLAEENTDQVSDFLKSHQDFEIIPFEQTLGQTITSADGRIDTLLLTPACHGTDGFFVAVMKRRTSR